MRENIPIARRSTPATAIHACSVPDVKTNGRPEEKPRNNNTEILRLVNTFIMSLNPLTPLSSRRRSLPAVTTSRQSTDDPAGSCTLRECDHLDGGLLSHLVQILQDKGKPAAKRPPSRW